MLTTEQQRAAVQYLRGAIRDGLTWASLPDSLRAVVEAADVVEPGPQTWANLDEVEAAIAVEAIAEWQASRALVSDGMPGPATRAAFAERPRPSLPFDLPQYVPHDVSTRALFRAACEWAGFPTEWADVDGLHNILRRESGGWVGRPNYTMRAKWGSSITDPTHRSQWPSVWAYLRDHEGKPPSGVASSATGLGQLLGSNARKFYPGGVDGIGDALCEAVGMLRYIAARYRDPATCWRFYELPKWRSEALDGPRPAYSYRALAEHGGPGRKPGEGY